MSETFAEWAGAQRRFRLAFGQILDLEEACGKVGIGAIYLHIVRHEYRIREVYEIIRQGLIGGGLSGAEAKRLVDERFDVGALEEKVQLAASILADLMAPIESDDTKGAGDASKPYDTGAILASFVKMGVPPQALRDMSYADFVAMCRAFGGNDAQPPTEDEFKDMLARMRPNG